MKRFLAIVLCAALCTSAATAAFAEYEDDFVVSNTGELVAYIGDGNSVISVPAEINGRPIKSIIDAVFYAKPIGSVYIDYGIEEIGALCFSHSTTDYIYISESVKIIGDEAFKDCKMLDSLSFESGDVELGKDALAGTGYLHISIPCTVDTVSFHDKIYNAKGDDEFTLDVMHIALVESMVEKDIFGHAMIICEACGFKGSIYMEDTPLPFEDVAEDAWYYPYVKIAYEFGILNGKSDTAFDPNANMTLGEAAKIAACLDVYNRGGLAEFEKGDGAWYQPYVDYCYDAGIIDSHVVFDWAKTATRAEMAYLFSRADDGVYEPNPDVPLTDIPDVDDKTAFYNEILSLYRRGIATGSNEYYAFYPDSNVKRSEAATFITRILCYDLRVNLPKG